MTAAFDFDQLLGSLLDDDGPRTAAATLAEGAIIATNGTRQRRPLVRAVDRRAWPARRVVVPRRVDRRVLLLVAAVLAAVAAGTLVVASRPTVPTLPASTHLVIGNTRASHCMSIDRVDASSSTSSPIVSCSEWFSLDPAGRWATERHLDPTGTSVVLDLIDIQTGERREVVRSADRGMIPGPISPDGRYVAWDWCTTVTFPAECGGTAVADLSTPVTRIVDLPEGTQGLRWSPDSGSLTIDGADGPMIANADGRAPRRIDSISGGQRSVLAWSPDSTHILTQGDRGLEIVARDGSSARRLADLDTSFAAGAWSPDGGAIALVRHDPFRLGWQDVEPAELWIVRADGGGKRRVDLGPGCTPLLETPAPDATPRVDCRGVVQPMPGGPLVWSPDGQRFAIPLVRVGVGDPDPVATAIVDPASGAVTLIDQAGAPAWSPDGAQLMVVTKDGVDVLSADGSDRRQVLDAAGSIDSKWGAWIPTTQP